MHNFIFHTYIFLPEGTCKADFYFSLQICCFKSLSTIWEFCEAFIPTSVLTMHLNHFMSPQRSLYLTSCLFLRLRWKTHFWFMINHYYEHGARFFTDEMGNVFYVILAMCHWNWFSSRDWSAIRMIITKQIVDVDVGEGESSTCNK